MRVCTEEKMHVPVVGMEKKRAMMKAKNKRKIRPMINRPKFVFGFFGNK